MYFDEHQHPFGPERRVKRRQFSTLSPIGHWLWYCPPRSRLFESTFLRSLRSTPVTEFHRYYGRSDSCLLGSSGPWSMNSDSFHKQVSLIHASGLPDHSVSKHLMHPRRHFVTLPLSATGFPTSAGFWTSPFARRLVSCTRPYRVCHPTDWSFTSCCFSPRLAATQLQLVTGRRAFT